MPSRVSPVDVVCAEIDDLFDSLMPADQAEQADRDGDVAELSRLLNSVDTETADAVTAREASLYAFLSLGSPAEAVRKEAEEFFARVRNGAFAETWDGAAVSIDQPGNSDCGDCQLDC